MQKHINYFDIPYRNINKNEDLSKFYIPNLALSNGTVLKELTNKYKNYATKIITLTDSKDGLLRLIQSYYFSLADLAIYLDIHNNDQEALSLYNNYTRGLKEAMDKYESIFGPLLLFNHENNIWKWVNGWPYEGGKK